MRHAVDAMEVLDWPEFKALAERMGINLEVSTTRLVIDLQEGHYAVVMHKHRAADRLFEVSTNAVSPGDAYRVSSVASPRKDSGDEAVPTWCRGF